MPPRKRAGTVPTPAKRTNPGAAKKNGYKKRALPSKGQATRASKRIRGQEPDAPETIIAPPPQAKSKHQGNAKGKQVTSIAHSHQHQDQEEVAPLGPKKTKKQFFHKHNKHFPLKNERLPLPQSQITSQAKTYYWIHQNSGDMDIPQTNSFAMPDVENQADSGHVDPNQAGPNQAGPDQTGPNQADTQTMTPAATEPGDEDLASPEAFNTLLKWLMRHNADPTSLEQDPHMYEGLNFSNLIPSDHYIAGEDTNISAYNELRQNFGEFWSSVRERGASNSERARRFRKWLEDLEQWKSQNGFVQMTSRHFKVDVIQCEAPDSNEYMVHRTVMMDIMDRFNLDPRLEIHCEGDWKLRQNHSFAFGSPYTNRQAFRSDLVVFFKWETLAGRKTVNSERYPPNDLEMYMHPDRCRHRCFPFLFIEAKHSGKNDLDHAAAQAMRIASQALWNIYKWMKKADSPMSPAYETVSSANPNPGATQQTPEGEHMTEFWDQVRVFSISMNAKTVQVRVHRAARLQPKSADDKNLIRDSTEGLEYYSDKLSKEPNDNGIEFSLRSSSLDLISGLIHNICLRYGLQTLLPLLQGAYRDVLAARRRGEYRAERYEGTGNDFSNASTSATSVNTATPGPAKRAPSANRGGRSNSQKRKR